MEQREITFPVSLLDPAGILRHDGYSRRMELIYRRGDVKSSLRLKEWDSYIVMGGGVTLRLTAADLGYASVDSAALFDEGSAFTAGQDYTRLPAPGQPKLPESSGEGDVHRVGKKYSFHFLHSAPGERTLIVQSADCGGEGPLSARLRLFDEPEESLVTALPFAKEGEFFYGQRIAGFRAEGYIRLGGREWNLDGGDSRAVLDWGRGVWPRECGKTWCCASGTDTEGAPFGMTLGEGGGESEAATENMLFLDGIGVKLGRVSFAVPEEKDSAWQLTDDEGRLELSFTPALEREKRLNVKLLSAERRLLSGAYSGKIALPDGRVIELRDLPGFAERAKYKW